MAPLSNPENRLWRTDTKGMGRNVYALLSNDVEKPSTDDPLLGVMESTELAEDVVNAHNGLLAMYGRRYRQIVSVAEQNPQAIAMHARRHHRVVEDTPIKISLEVTALEQVRLGALSRWLLEGVMEMMVAGPTQSVVEKLYRAAGGTDEDE